MKERGLIKILIVILVLIPELSLACPLCWGRYDDQNMNFSESNYPKNLNKEVKKFFPPPSEDVNATNEKKKCDPAKDKDCKVDEKSQDKPEK